MTTEAFTEAPVEEAEAPEEPQEAVSVEADIAPILSDPSLITLSNGRRYRVERLKTRGMLRLLKVFTAGAGDVLSQYKFSMDMDPSEFAGIFIGAVLFSVPEQEDETIEFIRSMVTPAAFISNPQTPQEREANTNEMVILKELLEDPEGEDTIEILSALITIEAPHILSLGKRLALLLDVQRKSQIAKASTKPSNSSPTDGGN